MKLPPLTNKAIRAYVETLPPDEPCARLRDPQHCIVAEYIAAAIDVRRFGVTVNRYHIDVYVWDDRWQTIDERHFTPARSVTHLIERFDALSIENPTPADVLTIFEVPR